MASLGSISSRAVGAAVTAVALLAVGAVGQSEGPEAAYAEAEGALEAGRVREAKALFEAMVEEWPRHRRANYQLGRLALDRGEIDTSTAYLEAAVEGNFPGAYLAWFYLGKARALARNFDGAASAFDQTLGRAPNFAAAMAERGRVLLLAGELEAGATTLQTAVAQPTAPPQAALLLAQLAIERGQREEAARVLDRLGRTDSGTDRDLSSEIGWLRQALVPATDTERSLAQQIDRYPGNALLYWALGKAIEGSDPTRARRLFAISQALDSENPVAGLSLAGFGGGANHIPAALPTLETDLLRAGRLFTDGQTREAAALARQLLEARELLVPAWMLLAEAAEVEGENWQAMEINERLLDWLGPVPGRELGLARAAKSLGALDLAACAVGRALADGTSDPRSWYLLALIESGRGNTEAAITAARRSIEAGFDDVRPWLELGDLYFSQMEIDASIAAYERAMAIDALAAEEVRPFALSSLTTEQFESLRHLLERHVEARPDSISTLYALGVMSLRENRLAEARGYLERLNAVAPDHRQVHYNLGQVYLRLGETERGQAEMERFQEIKAAEDAEWERHNQAHFRRLEARSATAEGRHEVAIPLYEQSIAEETAELSDYLELAEAYAAVGRAADSVQLFGQVVATEPAHRAALVGMIGAAAAAGEVDYQRDARRKLDLLDWPCRIPTQMNGGRG